MTTLQVVPGSRRDHHHCGRHPNHRLIDHHSIIPPFPLARSGARHAHLKLVPAVVDHQDVEQSQRIHADHNRRLALEFQLLEYVQVPKCDAGVRDLDGTEVDGGHGHDLAVLNVLRGPDDLIGFASELHAAAKKRTLKCQVCDGRLTARVDDGFGGHVTDHRTDDHQRSVTGVERHVHEITRGLLIAGKGDENLVVPEVDVDA